MVCRERVEVDTTALSPRKKRLLEMCEELSVDSLRAVELFVSALVQCRGSCPNALVMKKYLLALAEIAVDHVP